MMGLKIEDVSEDVLTIRRRIYRRGGRLDETKRGDRIVPLTDPSKRNILRGYLTILPDTSPQAWLFASETGKTPLEYSDVFRRWLQPALEAVGLRFVNFQVMRRT